MDSFVHVIDAFGGPSVFAAAIGIPSSHARTMRARDSVPAERWSRVVAEATKRELTGITLEALAAIAAKRLPQEMPGPAAEITAQDEKVCP